MEEFAIAESHDQGKPVWLAKVVDIPRAVLNFRFFASGYQHVINTYVTELGGERAGRDRVGGVRER